MARPFSPRAAGRSSRRATRSNFLSGTNQTATFDNFNINNQTGDLIFADPSVATINFNSTVANAGTNNLLDATNRSVVTLNASASRLTGAIQDRFDVDHQRQSDERHDLDHDRVVDGHQPQLTNSVVVFAPPRDGRRLQDSDGDELCRLGREHHAQRRPRRPQFGFGQDHRQWRQRDRHDLADDQERRRRRRTRPPAPASRSSSRPMAARSRPTPSRSPTPRRRRIQIHARSVQQELVSRFITDVANNADDADDADDVDLRRLFGADGRRGHELHHQRRQGAAEPDHHQPRAQLDPARRDPADQLLELRGGFASVGSFAAGAQGRWGLSDELTLIGGFSYNQWYASGISVENAPTVAGALIYDLWKWGESRPFFEVGGALTPYEDVHYTRYYANGLDDRGRQRLGDRPRPLAVRASGLDRPPFFGRRGGGLRRSRPELDADGRLHGDDQRPQPLPDHGEQRPRHAERRPPRRAIYPSLQRQYRGERQRRGRLRLRGRLGRRGQRLRLRPDRAERASRTRPGWSTARASATASTTDW